MRRLKKEKWCGENYKVVLSSGLADGGNTETSVAGIKQAIEGGVGKEKWCVSFFIKWCL